MHQKQPPANVALANPWLAIGIGSLKADWNTLDKIKLLIKSNHRKLNRRIIISLANAGLTEMGVNINRNSMENDKREIKKGVAIVPPLCDLWLLMMQ